MTSRVISGQILAKRHSILVQSKKRGSAGPESHDRPRKVSFFAVEDERALQAGLRSHSSHCIAPSIGAR